MATQEIPADWGTTRDWVASHFDAKASRWEELTSDEPVGRIRTTVRAGRRRMQGIILGWLQADLSGRTVYDAGCGPGTLAVEMGRRGAEVLGVDVSRPLIEVARRRAGAEVGEGRVRFDVADMLEARGGPFDHVVAMDSLLHYSEAQLVDAVARLSGMARRSLVFTFAPRTPFLATMHTVGRLLPRSNRSPSIAPMSRSRLERSLRPLVAAGWSVERTERVSSGFYISQALELVRSP